MARCTGCGAEDPHAIALRCRWPDGRETREVYCSRCRLVWLRQLTALGARFEPVVESFAANQNGEQEKADQR